HKGGSGELFGVRPDLTTYCKAIANGYPLAACLGRDSLKQAAQEVFFTGSYFTSAVPMAAGLANLKELQAGGGIETGRTMGEHVRGGPRIPSATSSRPWTSPSKRSRPCASNSAHSPPRKHRLRLNTLQNDNRDLPGGVLLVADKGGHRFGLGVEQPLALGASGNNSLGL